MKISYEQIHADETIDLGKGYTARIELPYDEHTEPPWENSDGHGPVSDWERREKAPGEMILCTDGRAHRFYDFAEAVKIARRDGWDTPPYKTGTPGERANRAALADYHYLRRWCNNDWHYIGVCVTVYRAGQQIGEDSLWGVEDCPNPHNDDKYYWREVAAEMIEGIVNNFKHELRERRYWAERDVLTR